MARATVVGLGPHGNCHARLADGLERHKARCEVERALELAHRFAEQELSRTSPAADRVSGGSQITRWNCGAAAYQLRLEQRGVASLRLVATVDHLDFDVRVHFLSRFRFSK